MKKEAPTGYTPSILLTYSTEHLTKKDKVRFHYALKGRDSKQGVVKSLGAEHIGPGVLLVPKKREQDITAFMEHWKCPHKKRDILIHE